MGHVIADVPVRQWVLSLPIPPRLPLGALPKLAMPVLQVTPGSITRHLLKHTGLEADADSGTVTLIQRFGSAAHLNMHLRCLVLDGVYWRGSDGAAQDRPGVEPLTSAWRRTASGRATSGTIKLREACRAARCGGSDNDKASP